ncbi:MAG: MoaD/ThiS family protein [Desulfobacterales bacterium]
MKIALTFLGLLRQHVRTACVEVDLPDGADLGELLDYIDRQFGPGIGPRIWDKGRRMFRTGIRIAGDDRYLESPDAPLRDGEQISIMHAMAGG